MELPGPLGLGFLTNQALQNRRRLRDIPMYLSPPESTFEGPDLGDFERRQSVENPRLSGEDVPFRRAVFNRIFNVPEEIADTPERVFEGMGTLDAIVRSGGAMLRLPFIASEEGMDRVWGEGSANYWSELSNAGLSQMYRMMALGVEGVDRAIRESGRVIAGGAVGVAQEAEIWFRGLARAIETGQPSGQAVYAELEQQVRGESGAREAIDRYFDTAGGYRIVSRFLRNLERYHAAGYVEPTGVLGEPVDQLTDLTDPRRVAQTFLREAPTTLAMAGAAMMGEAPFFIFTGASSAEDWLRQAEEWEAETGEQINPDLLVGGAAMIAVATPMLERLGLSSMGQAGAVAQGVVRRHAMLRLFAAPTGEGVTESLQGYMNNALTLAYQDAPASAYVSDAIMFQALYDFWGGAVVGGGTGAMLYGLGKTYLAGSRLVSPRPAAELVEFRPDEEGILQPVFRVNRGALAGRGDVTIDDLEANKYEIPAFRRQLLAEQFRHENDSVTREEIELGLRLAVDLPARRLGLDADEYIKQARLVVHNNALITGGNALYQDRDNPLNPIWTSRLYDELALPGRLPNEMTVDQARTIIQGLQSKGAFKQEEVEWVGVMEFLFDRLETSDTVTREELLNFVRQNGVQLIEIHAEKDPPLPSDIEAMAREHFSSYLQMYTQDETGQEQSVPDQEAIDLRMSHLLTAVNEQSLTEVNDLAGSNTELKKAIFAYWQSPSAVRRKARYSYYVVGQGGERYREILLTLPSEPTLSERSRQFNEFHLSMVVKYGNNIMARMTTEERSRYLELQRLTDPDLPQPDNYQSPHWAGIQNPLVHMRVDDRLLPDGRRVLFINEIQSDWHQAGRERGYRMPEHLTREQLTATKEQHNGETLWVVRGPDGRIWGTVDPNYTASEAIQFTYDDNFDRDRRVPNAPFKSPQAWAGLAIKRLLRLAVDEGYDGIMFTNGEAIGREVGALSTKQVEGLRHFYNNLLPSLVKKLAKENGRWEHIPGTSQSVQHSNYDEINTQVETATIRQIQREGDEWGPGGIVYEVASGHHAAIFEDVESEAEARMMYEAQVDGRFAVGIYGDINGFSVRLEFYDEAIGTDMPAVSEWPEFPTRGAAVGWLTNRIRQIRKEAADRTANTRPIDQGFLIPVTDKLRSRVYAGQPLFQGQNGAFQLMQSGQRLVSLFEGANQTTIVHELIHVAETVLPPQNLAAIYKALGVDPNNVTVNDKETLARAVEAMIFQGKLQIKGAERELRSLKETFREIYAAIDTIPDSTVKITKKVRQAFEQNLFGDEFVKDYPQPNFQNVEQSSLGRLWTRMFDALSLTRQFERAGMPKLGESLRLYQSVVETQVKHWLGVNRQIISMSRNNRGIETDALLAYERGDNAADHPPVIREMMNLYHQSFADAQRQLRSLGGIKQGYIDRLHDELNERLNLLVAGANIPPTLAQEMAEGSADPVAVSQYLPSKDAKVAEAIMRLMQQIRKAPANYVHIPYLWFEKEIDRAPGNVLRVLRVLAEKERSVFSLNQLIADGILDRDEVDVRELLASYAHRMGHDLALLQVREAAVLEGGARRRIGEVSDGWEDSRQPLFRGYEVHPALNRWIHAVTEPYPNQIFRYVSEFFKTFKMFQFYTPTVMTAYNVIQLGLGTAQSPLRALPSMWRGYQSWRRKDAMYERLQQEGLSSTPFSLPFDAIQEHFKEARFPAVRQSIIGATLGAGIGSLAGLGPKKGGYLGFLAAGSRPLSLLRWGQTEFFRMVDEGDDGDKAFVSMLSRLPFRALRNMIETSYETTWQLDDMMRTMLAHHMMSEGLSVGEAARTSAQIFGDYANIPPQARKWLNFAFFTPSFQISMARLYKDAIASGVRVAAGSGNKVDRINAGILINTFGIMLGVDFVMTMLAGWERDEWGKRYYQRVREMDETRTDFGQERELVASFSGPHDVVTRQFTRAFNAATRPGDTSPLAAWAESNYWLIHPVLRTSANVIGRNEDEHGNPLWQRGEDDFRGWSRIVGYLGRQALPLMSPVVGEEFDAEGQRVFEQQYSTFWEIASGSVLFRYARTPRDLAIAKEMVFIGAQMRSLNDELLRRARRGMSEEEQNIYLSESYIREVLGNYQEELERLEEELDRYYWDRMEMNQLRGDEAVPVVVGPENVLQEFTPQEREMFPEGSFPMGQEEESLGIE